MFFVKFKGTSSGDSVLVNSVILSLFRQVYKKLIVKDY